MDYQLYYNEEGEATAELPDEQFLLSRWLNEDVLRSPSDAHALIQAIESGQEIELATKQFTIVYRDDEITCRISVRSELTEEALELDYNITEEECGCGAADFLPVLIDWLAFNA